MKVSNKVLILTLLLCASVVFLIPAFVNIQYANERNAIDATYAYRRINPAKIVLIKGIPNCLIVPSDSLRIGSDPNYLNEIVSICSHDTLSLSLRESKRPDSSEVILYVPVNQLDLIISYSSKIKLWGQVRPNQLPSYHFELHHSLLTLTPLDEHQFFDRLVLEGWDNSSLTIPRFNHIKDLSLTNMDKTSISPATDIASIKTTFISRATVQITNNSSGTEIKSNP